MCLASLYDFTPEQRKAIARVEMLRALRIAKHDMRGSDSLMPVAVELAFPPRRSAVTGFYLELAA